MKATVSLVNDVNASDRTADLQVQVFTNAGVLLSTHEILIPIDIFSEKVVTVAMLSLLNREEVRSTAVPLTKEQVEDAILGFTVVS